MQAHHHQTLNIKTSTSPDISNKFHINIVFVSLLCFNACSGSLITVMIVYIIAGYNEINRYHHHKSNTPNEKSNKARNVLDCCIVSGNGKIEKEYENEKQYHIEHTFT